MIRVDLKTWLRRLSIALGAAFLVAAGTGLWALRTGRATEWIQVALLEALEAECAMQGHFESIEVGFFPPEVRLTAVQLEELSGAPFASVEEAILNLRVFPLLYGRLQLGQVAVLAPEATFEMQDREITNLPACMRPSDSAKTRAPVALGFDKLWVERGRFRVQHKNGFGLVVEDVGLVMTPAENGGTTLALGIESGTVTLDGQQAVVQRLRALGHVSGLLSDPRAVRLDELSAGVQELQVAASGSVDLLGPVIDARVSFKGPLADVQQFRPQWPEMSGRFDIDAQVAGPLNDLSYTGLLRTRAARIDVFGLGDKSTLRFRADETTVALSQIEVSVGDGKLVGAATIALDEALTATCELQTKGVPMGPLVGFLGHPGPYVDGPISGPIDLKGTLNPVELAGSAHLVVEDFEVFNRSWVSVSPATPRILSLRGPTVVAGPVRVTKDVITSPALRVERTGSRAVLDSEFHLGAGAGMRVTGEFAPFDLLDVTPIGALTVAGEGTVALLVEGPYPDLRAVGSLDLHDVVVGGHPLGSVTGTLRWSGAVVRLGSLEGLLARSRYNGNVMLDFGPPETQLEIAGTVRKGQLSDLVTAFAVEDFPDVKGGFTSEFGFRGPLDGLTGPAEFELADVEIFGERADGAVVQGRLEKGTLVLDTAEIRKGQARITAFGRYEPDTGALRVGVDTRRLRLSDLQNLKRADGAVDGPAKLSLDIRGAVGSLEGGGRLDVGRVSLAGRSFGATKIEIATEGDALVFSGTPIAAMKADARVRLVEGLPYSLEVATDQMPAGAFIGALLDRPLWEGDLTARASLSGRLSAFLRSSGRVAIETASLKTPSFETAIGGATEIKIDSGILSTQRLRLVGPVTDLSVTGRFGARVVDLRLDGRVGLAMVQHLFVPVDRSGGTLVLNASARGRLDALDVVGTGRLTGGMLEWRGLDSRLTDATAELSFSQSRVLIDRIDGNVDGGTLRGVGRIGLDGLAIDDVNLEFALDDVRPVYSNAKFGLEAALSGQLQLAGAPQALALEGRVRATDAIVRPKFRWDTADKPLERLTSTLYDPEAENLSFDISIDFEEPLQLRNDTSDIRLRGDLRLTGTNQRLGMIGSMAVMQGGRVGFRGREYDLESGVVELRERYAFQPLYDLRLATRACDAHVSLHVSKDDGRDEVQTDYASKPEMAKGDIVACLFGGFRSREFEGMSANNRNVSVVGFFGEALWKISGVDQEVKKVLPFDHIDVVSEYSSRSRIYEPRLLVAKEILSGRVRLEYSSSLFSNDDQRVAVRYRVTPMLTLQSGWSSSEDIPIGDLGFDMRYRWQW